MAKWRGTVEYTPLLTGKRVWEIVEVEAPTLEAAIQKALLKTGIGPIRRQLTHVKVDIGQVSRHSSTYSSNTGLEPIPPTREERLTKVYEIPIQPRAADIMGKLNGVYDKMMEVPDEICWRCRLNIDAHCTAFLLVGVEKDQEYRRGSTALCAYVIDGRIVK